MSGNDSSSERCTDRSTVLMISSIVDSDAMIVEVESTDQCAQATIALQAAVLTLCEIDSLSHRIMIGR